MLRIENLSKSFGGVRAVDRCSFVVAPRCITALIGPNGAGKTTAFQCISGFLTAESGRVWLGEANLSALPPWARARAGLSRTFQQVRLWPYLTVEEHLLLPQRAEDDCIASVLRSDSESQRERARQALDRVGLPHKLLDRLGSDLSYGQSKLLELARALLWLETVRSLPTPSRSPSRREGEKKEFPHLPGILLLDEPVAGVNPVLRQQIAEILKRLRQDGETVLVIEHDMDFVRSVADRVIVMAEGRVLLEGTPEEALRHPEVMEAYLGVEGARISN